MLASPINFLTLCRSQWMTSKNDLGLDYSCLKSSLTLFTCQQSVTNCRQLPMPPHTPFFILPKQHITCLPATNHLSGILLVSYFVAGHWLAGCMLGPPDFALAICTLCSCVGLFLAALSVWWARLQQIPGYGVIGEHRRDVITDTLAELWVAKLPVLRMA